MGRIGPNAVVKALIKRLGGHIWTSVVDPTNGGVGTAETNLSTTYRVPDAARTLLGWRPVEYPADQAAAEAAVSVFIIQGNNYNYQPQEVICGCIGGPILTTTGMLHRLSEYYEVNAPVSGGEEWTVSIEPLDAIAGNRRASAEFTWTDKKVPLPVIYSLCSRETSTGTTAGRVTGTSLNINNAKELIEVGGVVVAATTTIEEEFFGHIELRCTVWSPIQTIEILLEPQGAVADLTVDEGPTLAGLARRCERLKFTADRATVNAVFDLDVAPAANAGMFAHYIRWI